MADAMVKPQSLWAPWAWLDGAWAASVLLHVGADGCWDRVERGVTAPAAAVVLQGAVLPGLVDAHSHAFQRAFAGLAERFESTDDDFWSWRDRMYGAALRITPDELRAIAAQLYLELLRGGYTQVCEFHYLRHQPDGQPYAEPLTLAWAVADAAAEVGIGLTLMPAVYERAGFAQPALRVDQRRFTASAADTIAAARTIAASGRPLLNAGLVLHSLRAAGADAVRQVATTDFDGPIHIHVAEQIAEVEDCLLATGHRPIGWLAQAGVLDPRWQLVHATHATRAEIDAVAESGAGVVICPATEGNLGDGFCDLPAWLQAGVQLAIGSDSHATRDWREELRWLDYGQRLQHRRRGVAASAAQPASAERLWTGALAAGATAAGFTRWGLVEGARADLLVTDPQDDVLRGVPPSRTLDALVYSSPGRAWGDVMVAGRWVLQGGRHAQATAVAERFQLAMVELSASGD
ncbi:MAG: formimidoylglutamate deiminase [Pseudomonadota bacterium]|nr:formimidoylglutamate deiminase [Pseudomonadota bacterium]